MSADATTLPAGRELDATIGRAFPAAVSGWRKYAVRLHGKAISAVLIGRETHRTYEECLAGCKPSDGEWSDEVPVPSEHFSTDIAAAWKLVDGIKGRGLEINISHSGCRTELWDCYIMPCGGSVLLARESGETAPLAICRAALEAVSSAEQAQ